MPAIFARYQAKHDSRSALLPGHTLNCEEILDSFNLVSCTVFLFFVSFSLCRDSHERVRRHPLTLTPSTRTQHGGITTCSYYLRMENLSSTKIRARSVVLLNRVPGIYLVSRCQWSAHAALSRIVDEKCTAGVRCLSHVVRRPTRNG